MPTCKLCDQETRLIKAHIIPESFFPLGAGHGHLFYSQKGQFPKRARVGVYDNGILCSACDNRLGKLDDHAAKKLLHGTSMRALDEEDAKVSQYPQADSDIIWRFALSVAWRAHHSTHDFYQRVDLGPYAERFKAVLLSKSEDKSFGLWIVEFDKPGVPFLGPRPTLIDEVKFLEIYAGRFIFYLKVDEQQAPADLGEVSLPNTTPPFTMLKSWDESAEKAFLEHMAVASQENRNVVRRWASARERAIKAVIRKAE